MSAGPSVAASHASRKAEHEALGTEIARLRQSMSRERRRAPQPESASHQSADEESWLTTYLDMMTLLLVLLLVMVSIAEDTPELASPTPQSVASRVPPTGAPPRPPEFDALGEGIDVTVSGATVRFSIASEILFPSGKADLSLAGAVVLKRLLPVLGASNDEIAVEGHTDSVAISGARFPSNWELSSGRAGSVVRYFEANGIDATRLKAVGFAHTRPIADNATEAGRSANRRVELVMERTAEPQPERLMPTSSASAIR